MKIVVTCNEVDISIQTPFTKHSHPWPARGQTPLRGLHLVLHGILMMLFIMDSVATLWCWCWIYNTPSIGIDMFRWFLSRTTGWRGKYKYTEIYKHDLFWCLILLFWFIQSKDGENDGHGGFLLRLILQTRLKSTLGPSVSGVFFSPSSWDI